MSVQQIRSSQLITSYGPGAIVEAPGGPGVMRDIQGSHIFENRSPGDFEVFDIRLRRRLGNSSLVRIPTNAELQRPEQEGIYLSNEFPEWSLCVSHGIIYRYTAENGGCPKCPKSANPRIIRSRSRGEAISFIRACLEGHMDDLDWLKLIPSHRSSNCRPKYLQWNGGGSSLRNVTIQCPQCHDSANMGEIYIRPHRCSGRFPERGDSQMDCKARSRILQRNSTNLRMVKPVTSLTIPPLDTKLHDIIGSRDIQMILTNIPDKSDIQTKLIDSLDKSGFDVAPQIAALKSYSSEEVIQAVNDVLELPNSSEEPDKSRLAELIQLEYAAREGAPPATRQSNDYPRFEVNLSSVKTIKGPNGFTIRVTPVSRLTTTLAQTEYRRIDPIEGTPVSTAFQSEGREWFPAVQMSGEGVFIDTEYNGSEAGDRNKLEGDKFDDWMKFHRKSVESNSQKLMSLTELGKDSFHPITVWWHTLSHRLITSISLDSGYSAAAIRERIYVNIDPAIGRIRGGVLIYTSQPGGDGTLGGLIDSVEAFDNVLKKAINELNMCSNDPICEDQSVKDTEGNGAACYACLYLSETSCELFNMGLDRNLLLDNLP